jgi:putative transposase
MGHSYSHNHVHVVFSVKNRADLIPRAFEARLYSYLAGVARELEIPLLAAGGTANHSHLLFLLPPTMSLASAMNALKANSSRFMHEQSLKFAWQSGYGAFSVSASQVDRVTEYVRSQHEHHKKMSFEQELLTLLKRAGVAYDSNHVFG